MTTSTYKAQASLRELLDLLRIELFATMPVVTESFDEDGNPCAVISEDASPTAGEKVIVLRIKAIGSPSAKDIFGNEANQYSHHVIQFVTEANAGAGGTDTDDILTAVELLPLIVECGRKGHFVEWYQEENTQVPTVQRLVDGDCDLIATWRDLYWNVLKAS